MAELFNPLEQIIGRGDEILFEKFTKCYVRCFAW